MTDDQTRPIETPMPGEPVAAGSEPTPVVGWVSTPPKPRGPSRLRWGIGLAVAALAVSVAAAAVLLLGAPSTPEALKYIPGDAAVVAEVRMDLPGDQMEALGKLLAHFPGFQDQSTLQDKIDQALSKAVENMPGDDVDYVTQVKPFLTGPTFVAVTSLDDMGTETHQKNTVAVATTNGAVACDTTFKDVTFTHETYRALDLSVSSDQSLACVADGRFFIVGDLAQVKRALDAHVDGTGVDKSARYLAARSELGKDRLATLYLDGTAIKSAIPAANPSFPLTDVASAVPEWAMAGIRAENDALVFDVVVAPVPGATPDPSLQTVPPAHPSLIAPLAPADTLLFFEAQGVGPAIHNLGVRLQAEPELAAALSQLDQFGGVDGLSGWIDDAGLIVVRDGDAPAGALLLVAHDAASATEKATTLKTVLALALGANVDVDESTIEGVKVTTIHIPDASALIGEAQVGGASVPPIAIDFSIAARDRVLYLGIGKGVMAKVLGVKAGASLAENPAFTRAMAHGLPNPQSVIYVAAGASLDWLETVMPADLLSEYTTDVKPYVDPLESIVFTVVGDGSRGSTRLAFIVATP